MGRGPPAGGTRTGAPFPRPLDRQREQKRECPPGTPFYFGWIKADRPAGQTAGGSPPPPLGKVHFIGQLQVSRGDNTGALPLYPALFSEQETAFRVGIADNFYRLLQAICHAVSVYAVLGLALGLAQIRTAQGARTLQKV